ncbi:restriction endonuclease subunit S [Streptococcus oralis]|uniref:Restriction endonuclease subunit S n=1 Tax=Streptococcus oralis TaxID=1303 RepID=A0AAW5WHQ1_STROR|nr:restriction endonuclease subunit S [Streptococcus oralis]MCY7060398.1 restriction endonuclease subunit S [Streptococcus oralis]
MREYEMNILEEIQNCPVEWKELKDIAILKNGKDWKTLPSGEVPVYGSGGEMGEFVSEYSYDKPTVLIPRKGSISNLFYLENAFWNVDTIYYTEIDDKQIIPKYFFYYLTTIKLEEMATNPTRPSLTQAILDKVKIPIPPLEIQEKIVQILDKMTGYVTELTSELTSRKKQYSFYRDKLLSFEDEVYQVEWKVLKDVATLKNGKDWKNLPIGEIPVYGSGGEMGEFVADCSYDKPTVLIPRKGSISNLFYLEKAFWNVDTIYYTEIDGSQVIPKYFYYYLTTVNLEEMSTNPTRPSLTQAILDKIKIPVPSLEIQSRIVQVLDNFDMVCNDLNIGLPKEIELRQKQYEYFREKLLTFVAEGEYTESRVEEWDNSAIINLLQWIFGPIRVELGAICDFVRGNGLQKKDFTAIGKSVIHYGQIYTKYDFSVSETLSKTSEIVFEKLKKAQPNDLVMATTSENVEDVGKAIVWEGKEEIGISGDSYIIQTTQNSRYLNYWLRSTSFQTQKERKVTGTKVIRINSKDIEKFQIILPSLIEQKRIVSILDNFNTLTNSLSEGLPKEIELRQKQYEYWREQLLNFTR